MKKLTNPQVTFIIKVSKFLLEWKEMGVYSTLQLNKGAHKEFAYVETMFYQSMSTMAKSAFKITGIHAIRNNQVLVWFSN